MSRIEDLLGCSDQATKLCLQIQNGVRSGNPNLTYETFAIYTTLMIAGGEFTKDPQSEAQNSQLFAQSLQVAIDSMRADKPRKALSALLEWDHKWNDLTPATAARVFLPTDLMPIAIGAIRVTRDTFDDSAQLISQRFRKRQIQAILDYFHQVHRHFEDPPKPVNPEEVFSNFGLRLKGLIPFRSPE